MSPTRRSQWIASGLFVLSGFTALTYETIWFKRLGHIWGSSSHALAAVVATFLCGLGLGAWLLGRVADRSRRPLALYGWFELAIGACALAIPFEMRWMAERVAPLGVSLGSAPVALAAWRLALTFAVIGPPCILMGATLPLLTRQFASRGQSVGASAAWLYSANTLGAAAGAWCAGFVLLERLGLVWTNAFAVALNVAVGLGALLLARDRVDGAQGDSDVAPPDTLESVPPRALRTAAFATGLASIALQMLWAREIALLVGATTYAFSATVFVFILGLGLGSLWFRVSFSAAPRLERVVALATALVVLPALVGLAFRPELARIAGFLREARASNAFNAWLCSALGAALELVPTIGMGLLFPALVQLSRQRAARAGRVVGGLYAWNTLGSVAGASLTGIVLVPLIGTFWSFRAALLVYALVPVLLLGARNLAVTTSIVCAVALLSNWHTPDPFDTNSGLFMYGADAGSRLRSEMRPLYFKEGSTCNVFVLEGAARPSPLAGQPPERVINLRVNGKIDASSNDDMPMQLGIAYFPRFLRPRAKSVLVIGMGSGVTVGAAALFPGTQVTCCEIEPAIVAAARYFGDFNHAPLDAPNVEVVIDDGRSFVQGHPGPWDLILSEPSNPWIAGIANLFTEEFYRTVQGKLARDGVLVQWIQSYSFSEQEYALVVRTVTRVFPHCLFLRVSHYDTLILAANTELAPRAPVLDEVQRLVDSLQPVQKDMLRYYGTSDVRSVLLARTLLDQNGLQRFLAAVGGSELNTDLNMRLEFAAPRRLFHEIGDPAQATMRLLLAAYDASLQRELCARWRADARQLGALKDVKTLLFQHANPVQASGVVELALAFDPDDAELLVDRLLFAGDLPREEFDETTRRVILSSPLEALRLGASLGGMGQHNAARIVFEQLTAAHPRSATAWAQLAGELDALGKRGEAQAALDTARALDPLDPVFRPDPARR